ncbi:helix-turn-helix domain-containing protein [Bradyrhizobium rifense]|uniref:Helix-turn-helix domain-containing protein n=1 Tax=Bradyrhizobium rifense TaxID=515499 RepID=A0A5D3K7K1_9BRAD|nr:helix-turn-helix domain-containing protein [Bradyrhizobium rifense]TYL86674.1 helix-turn-helix domain-containing protein [Bradyrhizobium rifense]
MPELFDLAEVVRAFEQNSIHLMVRCVAEGTLSTMSPGAPRHETIVKRLEEFPEENSDTPLYLAEICAAVRAAERTLRAACEDHVGMGPIRYLALHRMHLVRRALLRSDSSMETVTRIATDMASGSWDDSRLPIAHCSASRRP